MSDCVNIITFDKNHTRLEMRFEGDDFLTATVKFELKNEIGMTTGTCVPIPVRSIFDITELVRVAIHEKTLRLRQCIESMQNTKKENKRGTKENKKK